VKNFCDRKFIEIGCIAILEYWGPSLFIFQFQILQKWQHAEVKQKGIIIMDHLTLGTISDILKYLK